MEFGMLYYKFSDYLKNKYNTKVYKIPVNIPVTCPNRDGKVAGGAAFSVAKKVRDLNVCLNIWILKSR
jgi:radical SAM superfamily enzyme